MIIYVVLHYIKGETSFNFVLSGEVKSQIKKKLIPWHIGVKAVTVIRRHTPGERGVESGTSRYSQVWIYNQVGQ